MQFLRCNLPREQLLGLECQCLRESELALWDPSIDAAIRMYKICACFPRRRGHCLHLKHNMKESWIPREDIQQVQYVPWVMKHFRKWGGKVVGDHLTHFILNGARTAHNQESQPEPSTKSKRGLGQMSALQAELFSKCYLSWVFALWQKCRGKMPYIGTYAVTSKPLQYVATAHVAVSMMNFAGWEK